MSGTAGQMKVSSGDLVAHAGQIDGIGDELTTAQQAGSAVRVDSAAYGKLCQFVPALLNVLQDQMIDGIGAVANTSATKSSRSSARPCAAAVSIT
jgi:hypothetical protein